MSASMEDQNESINLDEIEELISNEEKIHTESSSIIKQVQETSLSLGKSFVNDQVEKNQIKSVLTVKTSNIPGPVGLLPILKTNEELRQLKDNKAAREMILTNEEKIQIKRPKTSSDLFSLNIDNYPSYLIALEQLRDLFSCEPISINAALIKARLGIKKRIPLMCAAVTHYDRHENTILLDKSAHIRATFIGDDELLDNFNIHVGHTLVLRNVAVFTSTRRRHHYVNIHLQNIIAIQDPLMDSFSMPIISQEYQHEKTSKLIENEISAYENTSNNSNETFRIFSQSDHEDDEQPLPPPSKKINTGFNQIKTKIQSSSNNKFHQTISTKSSITITPSLSMVETKQISTDLDSEDLTNEFFSSW